MSFVGTVSNQSSIRSGGHFTRHLIVHTPDIVCQAQPSANASGLSNASITLGTPSSGSVGAIKSDYTVFITPTSDYVNDVQTLGNSEYLITYARNDGSGSTLDIGETTFQWSTSQYVTVVKDVRVHRRKFRFDDSGDFKDYDIEYRTPKPRIYNLVSEALEITSGSTVSKSFTPSAQGTISSWLWDVDGNTISTGSTSTQNITVDFTAGTHLVSLTVTNSSGVSHKLSVLIAVIPKDYNSILETGVIVRSLSHNQDGHACGFEKLNTIDNLLPGSMAIVCTKVQFNDDTSKLTTDMVGWLGEISLETVGDETWQRLQRASFGMLDIGFLLAGINLLSSPYELNSSPSAWGQLASCTPLDMAWSLISEQTTVGNVASIQFPSDYTDQVVKAYDTPNGTLVDILRTLAFNNNAGSLQFSPNGALVFDISLPYASTTVRDNADTVVTLSPQDTTDINLAYPASGVFAVEYVNAGATRYDATAKKMRDFYGRAPAKTEDGVLEERIEYMVFPQDTTADITAALAGRLAYNHWEAVNENLMGTLSNALGGYLEIRQQENVWLKLSIDEGGLLNSSISFDSNTRFIVMSVSQEYDPQNGSLTCSFQLREETGNQDNYSVISQELLAAIVTANLGVIPNIPAYPTLENATDDSDVYGDDYSDNTAGMPDPADEPTNQGQNNDPATVLESLQVPLTGQTITTDTVFEAGVDYLVTMYGKGIVGEATEVSTVTFDTGGYANYTTTRGTIANRSEVGSNALVETLSSGSPTVIATVDLVSDQTVSSASLVIVGEDGGGVSQLQYKVEYLDSSSSVLYDSTALDITDAVNQQVYERTVANSVSNVRFVRFTGVLVDTGSNSMRVMIDDLTVNTGSGGTVEGDAMFKIEPSAITAWGASGGMYFNNANIELASVEPSAYATDNTYQYIASIAGAPSTFDFRFVDTDGNYTENSGNITVKIEEIVTP